MVSLCWGERTASLDPRNAPFITSLTLIHIPDLKYIHSLGKNPADTSFRRDQLNLDMSRESFEISPWIADSSLAEKIEWLEPYNFESLNDDSVDSGPRKSLNVEEINPIPCAHSQAFAQK